MVTLTPSITGKTGKPIAGMVAKTNRLVTVTTEQQDSCWCGLGQPITFRRQAATNQAATDRVYASDLDKFTAYGPDIYVGATAEIFTVANGVRSLYATQTVTGGATWLRQYPLGNNRIVTTTSAEIPLQTYYRPNHAYYFRVAAINGSGGIGTYTSWQSYTSPATIGAHNATNTTSTLTFSGTSALAAPTGFTVGAKSGNANTVALSWNAVGGASGYVVELNFQNPALEASSSTTQYLDLDSTGLSIPVGAHVVLSKKLLTPPGNGVSARVWADNATVGEFQPSNFHTTYVLPQTVIDGTNYEWIAYTGGDPAPTGGWNYYLRSHHQTSGHIHSMAFHSGSGQIFWDTLADGTGVTLKVLLRSDTPGNFAMALGGVNNVTGDTTFVSTTSWAWYEVSGTVTTTPTGTAIYSATLTANTTSKYDVAAVSLEETGVNPNDLKSDYVADVPANSFIRDHRHIKPGRRTNSLENLVLPTGFGARKNGAATLHSLLYQCKTHSANPWIQLEWHLSLQEWEDLVAYLCAPVSSGNAWALARQAAGQATPWIDEFPQMFLEFGNEAWNSLSDFWRSPNGMTDTVTSTAYANSAYYGMICNQIINRMKLSPWWSVFRAKTKLIAGGWVTNPWGEAALPYAADIDYNSIAGYNGGWEYTDELAGEDGNSFLSTLGISSFSGFWTSRRDGTYALGTGQRILVYEAGPGYQFSGLNGSSLTPAEAIKQEVVMKSRAAGTATLHTFLYRADLGYDVDNYFRLSTGDYWTSHPSAGHSTEPYLTYAIPKLVHEAVGLCQVKQLTTVQTPTRSQDGEPAIKAYIARSLEDPTVCVIAAMNFNIDVSLLEPTDPLYSATPSGTEAITVNTPVVSCTGLEYYANSGNFRQHNRYPLGQRFNPTSGFSTGNFVADSLCVSMPVAWTPGTPLGDASQIVIDDTYGAEVSGLKAGNCVLIKMTGCVFE